MTGVRQSVRVGKESRFGSGAVDSDGWFALPPNFFLQATPTISTTELYSEGSKFFDTVDYGQFSGSWEISFAMDYEHLGLYSMIFDKVEHITPAEDSTLDDGKYKHVFSISNNARVGSFVIQGVVLNDITSNGGRNERFTLKGCVAKSIRLSRSSGASRMTVTMSGFYVDEETELGTFGSLYQDYEGQLIEFSCMFWGEAEEANYVANVESLTMGLDIGAAPNYTVCRSMPVGFYSGKCDIQLGMTTYANDFERYRARVLGGGKVSTNTTENKDKVITNYKFMCKRKAPAPEVTIAAFTECRDNYETFDKAIVASDNTATFKMEDVILNSFTRQKGDGSRLIDQMSSSKCRKLTMTIVNGSADLGYQKK